MSEFWGGRSITIAFMDDSGDSAEITCESLQKHYERAVYFSSATLTGHEFRKILELAMRKKAFAALGLSHLPEMRNLDEMRLSGQDLRLILFMAIKAHPRDRRRTFRVSVPSSRSTNRQDNEQQAPLGAMSLFSWAKHKTKRPHRFEQRVE
jgi:hypothetical protein